MKAELREQFTILARLGVKVERERPGKGGHKVLYCTAPGGARFVITVQATRSCPRGLKNFEAVVKKCLTGKN